ncbi:MAG: CotH kinase family protein, partial [Lachnospiraceae bacterium]|nr:CotH kinase family protein [Lachnospiraceae bacterium]
MVTNKYIGRIIAILMALAVLLCFAAMIWSDELSEAMGGKAVSMEYEDELFNTDEIISIDILMDEEEWEEMLSNALSEEYYVCDVVVNGVTFENVAIRPKGNTSLSSIAMDPDTDRYSLKLEFDHFESGQTCFGLDKLILNNNYADATNMKEAIVYDMFQYLDADASLYNYASVSVNGEYWGVYLALEGVEQSFMLRNYGTQDGELYKPDSMEMGGGDDDKGSFGGFPGGDFNFSEMPEMEGFDPENMDFGDMTPPSGFGDGFGGGGANLNYTDDDLDSYQTIWDGAITDSGDKDHKRVVKALKNISEGTDLEEYMDIDNILKYMAVHTFVVNMDSLSGTMAHNYYLYEYKGQLNIIPWDYNLSLGGMGNEGEDATSTINDAIDTPFSSTEFFDTLLENEEYLERYHEYLNMLVEEYVYGGRFDEVYNRIRSQIDELVETDPTAFYEYDEYL